MYTNKECISYIILRIHILSLEVFFFFLILLYHTTSTSIYNKKEEHLYQRNRLANSYKLHQRVSLFFPVVGGWGLAIRMLGGAGMLRLKELSEWPTFASKTKQFWICGQTSNIFFSYKN